VVANLNHVKLLIRIPLKNPLKGGLSPIHIASVNYLAWTDIFGQIYSIHYGICILWFQTGQHDYIFLSESDFDKSIKGDVVECPVSTAVYSLQSITCEISLYFQAASHYRLCKRKLLLHLQSSNIAEACNIVDILFSNATASRDKQSGSSWSLPASCAGWRHRFALQRVNEPHI